MKTDRYVKTMLTVIAICLVILVLNKVEIFPEAKASTPNLDNQNYALVPLNQDGSINVRLISSEEIMEVNIHEVGGNLVRKAIPIEPDANVMDVNITEVGGWRVNNRLPVEN